MIEVNTCAAEATTGYLKQYSAQWRSCDHVSHIGHHVTAPAPVYAFKYANEYMYECLPRSCASPPQRDLSRSQLVLQCCVGLCGSYYASPLHHNSQAYACRDMQMAHGTVGKYLDSSSLLRQGTKHWCVHMHAAGHVTGITQGAPDTHAWHAVVELASVACGDAGAATVPINTRATSVASAMAVAVAEVMAECTGQGNAMISFSGMARAEATAEAVGTASARILASSEVCEFCSSGLDAFTSAVQTVAATAVAEANVMARSRSPSPGVSVAYVPRPHNTDSPFQASHSSRCRV